LWFFHAYLSFGPDARASARRRNDLQGPADLGGALAHTCQAHPSAVLRLLKIETLPMIFDLHPERLLQVQPDVRLRGVSVFQDVVQGFLGDTKQALLFGCL
jgi:hypothetical protein